MTMLRQLRRRLQMKSKIALFFMILISFLLQCTLLHVISIGSITPNLILILCISMGLMRGRKSGLWTGFFCGFLVDMFYGSVFGFYALIYMYIGYLNGQFHHIFYPDDIKLPLISIFVSDLLYGILYYLTLFMLRGRFHFSYYLVHIIVPETVYTILITLLFYPFILWMNNRLEKSEQRSSRKFV